MPNPREVITRFYTAFAARDHDTMARCYAADAHFTDPVFTDLHGPSVGAMWRMLCERATDLRIAFRDVTATFTFRDGLIVRHVDRFDLYAWARQALGIRGVLLGWAPPVQAAIRRTAAQALSKAMR